MERCFECGRVVDEKSAWICCVCPWSKPDFLTRFLWKKEERKREDCLEAVFPGVKETDTSSWVVTTFGRVSSKTQRPFYGPFVLDFSLEQAVNRIASAPEERRCWFVTLLPFRPTCLYLDLESYLSCSAKEADSICQRIIWHFSAFLSVWQVSPPYHLFQNDRVVSDKKGRRNKWSRRVYWPTVRFPSMEHLSLWMKDMRERLKQLEQDDLLPWIDFGVYHVWRQLRLPCCAKKPGDAPLTLTGDCSLSLRECIRIGFVQSNQGPILSLPPLPLRNQKSQKRKRFLPCPLQQEKSVLLFLQKWVDQHTEKKGGQVHVVRAGVWSVRATGSTRVCFAKKSHTQNGAYIWVTEKDKGVDGFSSLEAKYVCLSQACKSQPFRTTWMMEC